MISKTHIVAQMPSGRRLNIKVYGGQSAIFVLIKICLTMINLTNGLSTHLHFSPKVIYTLVRRSTTLQRLHNFQQPKSELFTVQCSCYPLRRTPFSNYVRMRTGSLVPTPQRLLCLGTRVAHAISCMYASLCLLPGTIHNAIDNT